MKTSAITFDFHDTLVRCDEWFELEVRTLPSAFLTWHADHRGGFAPASAAGPLVASYRSLRQSIIEHGHELTAEASLSLLIQQAGFVVAESEIAAGVEALMRTALGSASAVPGAVETVAALAAAGIPLGVVSSAVYHPFLEWSLERFKLRRHFGIVVTSASAGYYKSRPEIYWTALTALDAVPQRSLHVGDSARFDIAGGKRAGMATAWLRTDNGAAPDPPPDLELATLTGSSSLLLTHVRSLAS